MQERALVTGAGGFIGHHLVKRLYSEGHWVRGVDLKTPEYEPTQAHEFFDIDLRDEEGCRKACANVTHIYHLAADMGGIGYISRSHADVVRNNTKMNIFMLEAARAENVTSFFFSSTACVYPVHLQQLPTTNGLKEDDAHPAAPEEGYGWEKLYMEKMCQYFRQDYGLRTCVARFHNVYGPLGTFDGGREKAPAALCRKIAWCDVAGEISVWGDGDQTRSFLYIDDCIDGLLALARGGHPGPVNIGSEEKIAIRDLVALIAKVAKKAITVRYEPDGPQGVRGRNSDGQLARQLLGWHPRTTLEEGMKRLYYWIEEQVIGEKARSVESTIAPVLGAAEELRRLNQSEGG